MKYGMGNKNDMRNNIDDSWDSEKTETYETKDGTGKVIKQTKKRIAWGSIAKFIIEDAIPFARSILWIFGAVRGK